AVVAAVGDLLARVLLPEAAESLAVPDLRHRFLEQVAEHHVVGAAGAYFAGGRHPDRRPRLAAGPAGTLLVLHRLEEIEVRHAFEARADLQSELIGAL